MTYRQFLSSAMWKELREAVLRRDKRICRKCGRRASQVHHLEAAKSWIEPKLMIPVCGRCHRRLHGKPDRKQLTLRF